MWYYVTYINAINAETLVDINVVSRFMYLDNDSDNLKISDMKDIHNVLPPTAKILTLIPLPGQEDYPELDTD